MNLHSFKVNRVFGPAQYVKMQATFPEVEFLRILFRLRREEGKLVVVCPRPP